jgi:hypothetical protein
MMKSMWWRCIVDAITGHDWGLSLLDEVHVVPAKMFPGMPVLLSSARLRFMKLWAIRIAHLHCSQVQL